jgi:hypothetical protein
MLRPSSDRLLIFFVNLQPNLVGFDSFAISHPSKPVNLPLTPSTPNNISSSPALPSPSTALPSSTQPPFSPPSTPAGALPPTSRTPRLWPESTRVDIQRLGTILDTLAFKAFAPSEMSWQEVVMRPLRIGKGHRPDIGAVQRLESLMKTFVIRHRYVRLSFIR